MAKFHVNEQGEAKPCKATKRACKFGGATGEENHYSSREEALAAQTNKLIASHGATTTLSKTASRVMLPSAKELNKPVIKHFEHPANDLPKAEVFLRPGRVVTKKLQGDDALELSFEGTDVKLLLVHGKNEYSSKKEIGCIMGTPAYIASMEAIYEEDGRDECSFDNVGIDPKKGLGLHSRGAALPLRNSKDDGRFYGLNDDIGAWQVLSYDHVPADTSIKMDIDNPKDVENYTQEKFSEFFQEVQSASQDSQSYGSTTSEYIRALGIHPGQVSDDLITDARYYALRGALSSNEARSWLEKHLN